MSELWEKDKYLRTYIGAEDKYDLFSFDVFDTILFRHCERPVDVFAIVWERVKKDYPDIQITPEEYLTIRREAERAAYRKNSPLHNFRLIFDEMVFPKDIISRLMETEIEVEKEMVYLNETVNSLISYLLGKNKKIVLVSDMYHSSATIEMLLKTAGFNMDYIQKLYVSSEYSCHKAGGFLFDKIIEENPGLTRESVIHLGDNIKGDYAGAKMAGFVAQYYGDIPADYQEDADVLKINQICREIREKRMKNVAVFGAGHFGKLFCRMAKQQGIHILEVLDNNVSLQGQCLDGIPITSLNCDNKYDCIVIATMHHKEIYEQLNQFYEKIQKPFIWSIVEEK